ncbi:683_t:CDS:2 [Paraglomus occultum]|uniref:683_t:CDS:1 n=1 Tax=Paraglomus occultum TaxID=144539 RepID=A0A9N9A6X7_9GLOM|nr:683_t:CDS:2 [Paraglomus occultum]
MDDQTPEDLFPPTHENEEKQEEILKTLRTCWKWYQCMSDYNTTRALSSVFVFSYLSIPRVYTKCMMGYDLSQQAVCNKMAHNPSSITATMYGAAQKHVPDDDSYI